MAGYNQLKASIASVIKTNNAREITGQLLQNVLNQMVGVIGENLQLAGFADPTTNPGQPDQNIFYIAEQEGVYSHFNNTVLEGGLSFLMWKDGNWSSHTMQVVTEEYIKNHYVSIDFFRSIFCVYDENGNEILPNNEPDPILGTQQVIDNIKAQVGLWTEYYLSALGRATGGGGGGGATSLDQLSDVSINGTPTIILDRGKLYRENMKKAKLDLSEFMLMCRQAGYFNLNDIQTAVYEYDGKLSVLPVSTRRPVNPADMNLSPPQETILAEVIMDGRILDENLKRMGLNTRWLQKRLEEQGYQSADEVFLGLCGADHSLTLFRGE